MYRFFILVTLILASCHTAPESREVIAEGKVRLMIPQNLVQSPNPNPDAILHFEDTLHSLYLLVLAESGDSMKAYGVEHDLNSYFTESCSLLGAQLSSASVTGLQPLRISGADGFRGNVKGMSGKEAVMYTVAAVQTKKNFYQVVCAYPQQDSSRWKPVCEELILSFREL